MRRADRLFQIVQILRRGDATAQAIADELEVTPRTVYRDVADLASTGVPIRGEAGVGYTLEPGFDLPPLMFDEQELEALVLGCRIVGTWGDGELARSARDALAKVDGVLPERLRRRMDNVALHAPDFVTQEARVASMGDIRRAIRDRQVIRLTYEDGEGARSERRLRPLALYFWGTKWTLAAWCELRDDFRNFRVDRVVDLELTGERFVDEPGRGLDDFLSRQRD